MMVVMRSPYSGGVMTVDVSKVERLAAMGWVLEGARPVEVVAPLGDSAVDGDTPSEEHSDVPVAGGVPKGNASRAVWRDYAESLGIVTDGLTRAQLREAVQEVHGA